MSENVTAIRRTGAAASRGGSKVLSIAVWVASLSTAGILGMAAFAKLFDFNETGSRPLADALGVGRGVVAGIGLVELAALVLILIPRTRAVGALVAVGTMLGALFSHATTIGFRGSPTAEMWPLAVVVLAASGFVLWVTRGELPGIGAKLSR
jgi:hypothetical protein